MNASTITIQSPEESTVTGDSKLQVVKGLLDEKTDTSVISITEKTTTVKNLHLRTEFKTEWQMPPRVYGYLKGRDNDPL